MKQFLTSGLLTFLLLIGANALAGERNVIIVKKRTAKTHVVKARPIARQVVLKPSSIKVGYVWTEGYWKWNNRSKTYIWINGKVVRKKKNKVWMNGRWTKKSGGYYYDRGHWA
jgi:hypothetical protein